MYASREYTEEVEQVLSDYQFTKNDIIDSVSICNGFVVVCITTSAGISSLLLWNSTYFGVLKVGQKRRADELSMNSCTCQLDVECSKIRQISMSLCVNSDEKTLILIGSTDDSLFRWELSCPSINVTQFSLKSTVSCQLTTSLSRLCVDNHGERTACIENKTTTIRNNALKRTRAFTSPTSKDNDSANELSAVTFAGGDQSIAIVAYENGLIEGWDIANNELAFRFSCSSGRGMSNSNAHTASPVSLLVVDEHAVAERGTEVGKGSGMGEYSNFFLLIGCREGRVKQYEMLKNRPGDEFLYTHRECASLDMKRELRFNSSSSSSSSKSTDYSAIAENTSFDNSKGVVDGGGAIGVKKELVVIPLVMLFVQARLRLEPVSNKQQQSTSGKMTSSGGSKATSNKAKAVSVANSHVCVLTSTAIVFINMNTFKIAQCLSLESLSFAHTIHSSAMSLRYLDLSDGDSFSRQTCGKNDEWQADGFARGTFGDGVSQKQSSRGLGEEEDDQSPSASVDIVLLTAFERVVKMIRLPLFSASDAPSVIENTGSRAVFAVNKATEDSAGAPKRLNRWKSDNDIDRTASRLAGVTLHDSDAQSAQDDSASVDSGSMKRRTESVFTDPGMELSFIVRPSLAAQMESSGRGRSLLEVSLKAPPTPLAQRGAAGGFAVSRKDTKGKCVDHPVTFHARIKSSGYGEKPLDAFAKRRLEQANKAKRSISAPRGQPATRTASAGSGEVGSTAGRRPLVSSAANLKTGVRTRQYPVDCEPMSLHQAQNDFLCRSPIHNIVFSEDASLLGIAANDAAVLAVRLPVAKNNKEAISYMGHNGRVNGISFSHTKPNNQQMLLSCSVDGTARVWKGGRVDSAAVLFSHTRHQPGDIIPLVSAASIATGGMGAVAASLKATASLGAKPSTMSTINALSGGKQPVVSSATRNRPFGSDVTSAQFYYMDKFALLTVKSSVLMYTYDTEAADAKNDLKRLLSAGKYKLVHSFDLSARAQSVCAVGCVNSVQSPIVLCATSDKMLNVLDASVGSVVRQIESPHDKNIHCIALPQPSIHVTLGDAEAYNLFATSAIDNVIALWDIRTPRCVARYASHVNKREPVSCALSPCLRYIATGSEDKTARIMDIRTGRELARLTGHRDVVSSVAFNPLFSQLATGSYDGQVRFYVDPLVSPTQVGI